MHGKILARIVEERTREKMRSTLENSQFGLDEEEERPNVHHMKISEKLINKRKHINFTVIGSVFDKITCWRSGTY